VVEDYSRHKKIPMGGLAFVHKHKQGKYSQKVKVEKIMVINISQGDDYLS